MFSPGDHILFKSGAAWTGSLHPKGSGTERHCIVVDRCGDEAKPAINAGGQAEDTPLLKNQEYWEIRNLELTNTSPKPAVRRGVHLVADNYGSVHHVYIRGLTVHNVNGVDDARDNGGIVYRCFGGAKPSRFIDLRIEDKRSGMFFVTGIAGE